MDDDETVRRGEDHLAAEALSDLASPSRISPLVPRNDDSSSEEDADDKHCDGLRQPPSKRRRRTDMINEADLLLELNRGSLRLNA
jgi:hypothetical protein